MTQDPPASGWRLDYIDRQGLFARLRRWADEATTLGRRNEFIASLKVINEKVTTEPLEWGDPQYRARSAGFVMCHGLYLLLHVYYAVHEETRTVWIKEILPLPGQGFSEPPGA
jgi:hypothetical protein